MKTVLKLFATFILVIIAFALSMQAITKIWTFPEAKPFSGTSFFNPYAGISSGKPYTETFLKANFHAHTCVDTRHKYTTEEFINAYKEQGYDIIGITDHQIINDRGTFPSYEHGYGFNNFHIGMFDTRDVDWIDNLLMVFPRHQMQSMFNRLDEKADVLVFNHSDRLRLMSSDGIEYIRGYDLFEIPPTAIEEEPGGIADIWDRILSTGYYVPLVANDDAHSIINRESQFQRAYTMVYRENIVPLTELKMGHCYGVCLSNEKNVGGHIDIPQISSIKLIDNLLSIEMTHAADTIKFIGQDGKVLCSCTQVQKGEYSIKDDDTYVRIEIKYDGIKIFTNPIARISKGGFAYDRPEVNIPLTVLNWILWIVLVFLDVILIIKLWKKKKQRHYDNSVIGLGLKPIIWN